MDHDPMPPSDDDLAACVRALTALAADPRVFFDRSHPGFAAAAAVRAAANRMIVAITGTVAVRCASRKERRTAGGGSRPRRRPCYVCRQPFAEPHPDYPALCVPCGNRSRAGRDVVAEA